MTSKTLVLITGANQGIGYETARCVLLSSADHHVIVGSRCIANGQSAVMQLQALPNIRGSVSTIQIDVADPESVDAAVVQIDSTYGHLDILVNNAGVYGDISSLRYHNNLNRALAVNVIGAATVTDAFLPLLRKSSVSVRRLIFVTCSFGSLAFSSDPKSRHYGPYANELRVSKAALNMLMVQYNVKLAKEGIRVMGVDPGFCSTNMTGNPFALRSMGAADPVIGGLAVMEVITGERDRFAGRVVAKEGICPW